MILDQQYAKYSDTIKSISLANFKSDKVYREVLEHIGKDLGITYYELIKKEFKINPILNFSSYIEKNDSIGNPKLEEICGIVTSPSNFRYIYQSLLIADKCKKWFGNNNIRILEIGGGYGGLAFYLDKLLNCDFTLIDLPEVVKLQEKYLNKVNVKAKFISCEDIEYLYDKKFDLVVSNYALSEIGDENQRIYFEKIIKNCDKKFFTWNYLNLKTGLWGKLTMKKILFKLGFKPKLKFIDRSYKVEKERPQTGAINTFIYSKNEK